MEIKELNIGDIKFSIFQNDWVGQSIVRDNVWESHIHNFIKAHITQDDVFVDIGSNYGWHSIFSSLKCNQVYSFEPQKVLYDLQLKNIKVNSITNVTAYNLGLGDVNEFANLNKIDYSKESLNIGDLSIGTSGERVEIRSLDSFNLPRVDWVKIDIQGYEIKCLTGAIKTIQKHRPYLIIEVENHQLRRFNYSSADLFKLLKEINYNIYLLDYHYLADHICIPAEKTDEFLLKSKYKVRDIVKENPISLNLENKINKIMYYEN